MQADEGVASGLHIGQSISAMVKTGTRRARKRQMHPVIIGNEGTDGVVSILDEFSSGCSTSMD